MFLAYIQSTGAMTMMNSIKTAINSAAKFIKEIGALTRAGRALAFSTSENWPRQPTAHRDNFQHVMSVFERNGVNMKSAEQMVEGDSAIKLPEATTFLECRLLAQAELKAARSLLSMEISRYPTPIAGCDCQFNHLLAERRQISEALCALEVGTPVLNLKPA